MHTVTVTIGRNVPTRYAAAAIADGIAAESIANRTVLTDEAWRNFGSLIIESLKTFESNVDGLESAWVETHDGVGEWEGVQEQSRKITLLWDGQEPSTLDKTELLISLTSARSGYYQDAVAVSFGDSTLI